MAGGARRSDEGQGAVEKCLDNSLCQSRYDSDIAALQSSTALSGISLHVVDVWLFGLVLTGADITDAVSQEAHSFDK